MADQTNENQNAAGRLPRLLLTLAAPVLSALIMLLADLEPGKPAVTATLAAALLMALWWVAEVVPLAVTSLLPIVLFPALGIMDGRAVEL